MYQQCGYIYLKPKTVTSWFNHGVKIKDRNNRTIVPQNMKTIKMKEKAFVWDLYWESLASQA